MMPLFGTPFLVDFEQTIVFFLSKRRTRCLTKGSDKDAINHASRISSKSSGQEHNGR